MTWDLGVLFGKGDRLPDRSAPALQILADCGLTKPDDELVGVIRIALMHRSYLYENQDLLPGIKPKHLDALALVGSIFRRRTAAINTYQRYETATNGLLSRDVNHIDTVLPSWTAKADWFRSSTLLGKGYTTSELPRKALASLFDQLVGLLCLADESAIAEALLADLFTQARSGSEIVDPKTTLQEILSGRSLQYEYSRTGPDHAASHHAVVTDQAGRSGTGDGGNKTAASQAAALDFIQTHCLDLLPTNPLPSGAPRIPYPITTPVAHANEVARLQEIFNLPPLPADYSPKP